jgi:hypothetical protein
LWAEAKPAAGDPAFAIAVIERIERRQMLRRVLFELVPLVAMLAAVGWALAPAVESMLTAGLTQVDETVGTGAAIALSVMLGIWAAVGALGGVWPGPALSGTKVRR